MVLGKNSLAKKKKKKKKKKKFSSIAGFKEYGPKKGLGRYSKEIE